MRHSEEWWDVVAPASAVRCEGHTQDGHQCRREAIAGATVCRQHGGAAPQVRQQAAARIGNAADSMVKSLLEWVADPSVEVRDKVKIAQDLLDRAGLNSTEKHEVKVDSVESLFLRILADGGQGLDHPAVVAAPAPDPQVLEWNAQVLREDDEHEYVPGEVVEVQTPAQIEAAARPEKQKTPPHIRKAIDQEQRRNRSWG